MPSTSINIGYRPPRIATLIRAGRLDDLGDAAVKNTHLWGGIRNPIVSVGDNVDVDEVVAELAWWQPDVVMAHGDPAPSITAVLDRMEHLRRPVLAGYGDFPYADVRLICRHFFETTFRFEGAKSRAAFVNWPDASPLDPFLSVMFGRYSSDQSGEEFRRAFGRGLRARVVDLADGDADADVLTPIDLTGVELSGGVRPGRFGVVVGSPTDSRSLAHFWNRRADGWDIVFWPINAPDEVLTQSRAQLQGLITRWGKREPESRHAARVWRHDVTDSDGRSTLPEEVERAFREADIAALISDGTRRERRTNGATTSVWAARAAPVLASIEDGDRGTELVAALPPHPFHAAKAAPATHPLWLVTLSTFRTHELGDHTLDCHAFQR